MSVPLKAGVLIADDHGLVRDGLRMVIDAAPDLEVVAVAEDGNRAVERGLDPRVDLALLDVAMPRRTGLQAARELTARRPELRVLMLSMHNVFDYFLEAVKAGASGYVLKTVADRDLVLACRAALRGETFIYPGMVRSLLREHLERAALGESQLPDDLTPRESEVIKLIAEGLTSDEIARELTISPRTVERHRENILGKLGMRNRVELTRYAIRQGLVEP
ncbi:MAG TPA: response regulator transcription factor [Solirubrobacteraceae bacterium]|nr:response regulator transcription factor [Solirubrobacteraceae bacterium]